MALQKTLNSSFLFGVADVDVTNVFVYVEHIDIRRKNPGPGWEATANITLWESKTVKDSGGKMLGIRSVVFNVPGTLPTTDLKDWVEDQIIASANFTSATKISD